MIGVRLVAVALHVAVVLFHARNAAESSPSWATLGFASLALGFGAIGVMHVRELRREWMRGIK